MKIHLVFAPTTYSLNYGDLGKGIDPPLGILYIASYLRRYCTKKTEIRITDGLLEGFDKTLKSALDSESDVVGISAVTTNIEGGYKLINCIKKERPRMRIVLGGPHPTALPEEAFERSNVDVVVTGEGEETFAELAEYYDSGEECFERLRSIDGIFFRNGDKPVRTGTRAFIKDLDSIPFPARDLVEMKRYTGYPVYKAAPSTAVLSSRGCPFNCTFCSNNVWKTSQPYYRRRSVQNIADELEFLSKEGYREVFDSADEFNTNLSNAKDLLREIIRRKLAVNIKCQLRAKPMDEELAGLMKEAGIWYVHLGIESANEDTLEGIRKNVSLADVERCCRILKKHDIKIWGLFMYFNIWEREGRLCYEGYEQSIKTFDYARKLHKNRLIDYFGGSITTPVPGSDLWDIAVRHDLIKPECVGKWDMWFYKRDLRLISRIPGLSESSIFRMHQKATKYTVRCMLLGRLLRLGNLRFNLLRGFYFLKRQAAIALGDLARLLGIK